VVWAINEGRGVADSVNKYLIGTSLPPSLLCVCACSLLLWVTAGGASLWWCEPSMKAEAWRTA